MPQPLMEVKLKEQPAGVLSFALASRNHHVMICARTMIKNPALSAAAATFFKDLLFLGPFFLLSFLGLMGSVPSTDPFWIAFWAGMVALSMTGVAWLALQMFKVVLFDQRERNRAQRPEK